MADIENRGEVATFNSVIPKRDEEEFDIVEEASYSKEKDDRSIFAMLAMTTLLAFFILSPAIFILLTGDFTAYSLRKVKIGSAFANPEMEFFRISLFIFSVMALFILLEYLIPILPKIALFLMRKSGNQPNTQLKRSLSYYRAAKSYIVLVFWILSAAIVGAFLLYRTNFITTLQSTILGVAPSSAVQAAKSLTTIRNTWFYLERFMLVTIVFCIFWAAAKYLMEFIRINFHQITFEERVTNLNARFEVITKLYSALTTSGKKNMKLKFKERYVELMPDKGGIMETEKKSQRVAHTIYQELVPEGRDFITIEEFKKYFHEDDLEIAFRIFDRAGNGDIDQHEIRETVMGVYYQRHVIADGLLNNQVILQKLDSILVAVALFLTFTFTLPVFELQGAAVFAIFGILWTSLGFLFQNTAKTCFESFVFVFVEHAFDVGDSVLIDKETLFVERVEIFTTIFKKLDGTIVYIPNSNLASKNIYNIRRSGPQTDFLDILLASSTSIQKVWEFRDRLERFVRGEPKDFTGKLDIVQYDLDGEKIKLVMGVQYKGNFQDNAIRNNRKNKFMSMLKQIAEDLEVTYYP